jgi:hypothetical protein
LILRISNKLQTTTEISDTAIEVRESNVAANTARALEEQPRLQVKQYKQYKRQPNGFPAPKTKSAKKGAAKTYQCLPSEKQSQEDSCQDKDYKERKEMEV